MSTKLTAEWIDLKQNETQLQSHFKIQIEGINEELTAHVRSANLPSRSFDIMATPYFNETNKQAGKANVSDLSISLHDAIGIDVALELQKWQEQILNSKTGVMGYAADYKRAVILVEYDKNGTARARWRFQGCFPSTVNYGNMNRDSVEKKVIDVTLSVDKAWREY